MSVEKNDNLLCRALTQDGVAEVLFQYFMLLTATKDTKGIADPLELFKLVLSAPEAVELVENICMANEERAKLLTRLAQLEEEIGERRRVSDHRRQLQMEEDKLVWERENQLNYQLHD